MKTDSIKKRDLVKMLLKRCPDFPSEDLEEIVNLIFEALTDALSDGRRIEIRGFGNFSVHPQKKRRFINPKTGKLTECPENLRIVFKAGKNLVKIDNETGA